MKARAIHARGEKDEVAAQRQVRKGVFSLGTEEQDTVGTVYGEDL